MATFNYLKMMYFIKNIIGTQYLKRVLFTCNYLLWLRYGSLFCSNIK